MGVGIGGYKLCPLCHHKKMYQSTPKDKRCGTKQREAKGQWPQIPDYVPGIQVSIIQQPL